MSTQLLLFLNCPIPHQSASVILCNLLSWDDIQNTNFCIILIFLCTTFTFLQWYNLCFFQPPGTLHNSQASLKIIYITSTTLSPPYLHKNSLCVSCSLTCTQSFLNLLTVQIASASLTFLHFCHSHT